MILFFLRLPIFTKEIAITNVKSSETMPFSAFLTVSNVWCTYSTKKDIKIVMLVIKFIAYNNIFLDYGSLYTVDSRYLEIEGTLKNTSRYPYFDISDL